MQTLQTAQSTEEASAARTGLGLAWLAGPFVLVWTSGYVVGALATRWIAPETVTVYRFVVASVILAVLALVRRERWPSGPAQILTGLGVGAIFFGLQFGALYLALARGVPAGTVAMIACSSPLVVAAVSALVGWERLTRRQWIGVGVGVLGVVITLSGRVERPPHWLDLGWALLGLGGLAGGTILTGRLRQSSLGPLRLGGDHAALSSVQILGGAVVVGAIAPFVGPMTIPWAPGPLITFAWLAVVTGVGAPLLMFVLIQRAGAVRTSSLLFVVPALTAIASWPLLGTPITPTTATGLVASGAGLLLVLARQRGHTES